MIFSNRTYDRLKWFSLVFLPAFITFVGVVLNCFNVSYADIILTISIAFNTFLGSILGISTIKYNKDYEGDAVDYMELEDEENESEGNE